MTGQAAIVGKNVTNGGIIPDAAVPTLWAREAWEGEREGDFFMEFEGSGPDALIRTKTDTTKDQGMSIYFPTYSGMYGRTQNGDPLYDTVATFDKPALGGFSLTVDYVHHATSFNTKADALSGMRYELAMRLPRSQGELMGRVKTQKAFLEIVGRTPATNRAVINSRGTIDRIISADILSWSGIVGGASILKSQSGKPAEVGKNENGHSIKRYMVIPTEEAMVSLKSDTDYKAYAKDAGPREKMNKVFSGDLYDVDGHMLRPYQTTINDAAAPYGAAICPQATVGSTGSGATASSHAQTYFTFGTNALYDYTRDFPLYAYPFTSLDTLAWSGSLAGSGNKFCYVYDPATGKSGMFEYSANDGVKLTIVKRLGAVTSGVDFQTVGGRGYADFTSLLDPYVDGYPAGCRVFACNRLGVPYGYTVIMGKSALYRGYGSERNVRGVTPVVGGFQNELYIRSVTGQTMAKDVQSRTSGVMLLAHALVYPGITFQSFTS